MPQQVRLQRGVLDSYYDIGGRVGGSGPCCPELTSWIEQRVGVLPWAESGEIQGCHWWQTDPTCQRIPPLLQIGELVILRGGPVMILVLLPYCVRGPQRRYQPIP